MKVTSFPFSKTLFILIVSFFLNINSPAYSLEISQEEFIENIKTQIEGFFEISREDIIINWKDESLKKKLKKVANSNESINLEINDYILKNIIGRKMIPVNVLVNGKLNRTIFIKCSFDIKKEVLVSSKEIKKNQEINQENTKYKKLALNKNNVRKIIDLEELSNMVAISNIKAESIIDKRMFKKKKIIVFKGNRVTIKLVNGSLTLIGKGIILENGYLNQKINVRIINPSTNRVVSAEVLNSNLVYVNMGD